MTNVTYTFSDDGKIAYGKLVDGSVFMIDSDMIDLVKDKNFYTSRKGYSPEYIADVNWVTLHDYILPHREGFEVDHINHDTFDNRKCNLRYCTHQQNQINQDLQRNNTSGVAGVSWYQPRRKYRARIKIGQIDIHLGYYETFLEATQARNVGMECMFGEFGVYNNVPPAPKWIREKVINKCKRFADLSVCEAFFNGEISA